MPILTATAPPRKRRAPVWVLVLAVVVLPVAGVFGWSCYQPIQLDIAGRTVTLHRNDRFDLQGRNIYFSARFGFVFFKLPGGRRAGWYGVQWNWW